MSLANVCKTTLMSGLKVGLNSAMTVGIAARCFGYSFSIQSFTFAAASSIFKEIGERVIPKEFLEGKVVRLLQLTLSAAAGYGVTFASESLLGNKTIDKKVAGVLGITFIAVSIFQILFDCLRLPPEQDDPVLPTRDVPPKPEPKKPPTKEEIAPGFVQSGSYHPTLPPKAARPKTVFPKVTPRKVQPSSVPLNNEINMEFKDLANRFKTFKEALAEANDQKMMAESLNEIINTPEHWDILQKATTTLEKVTVVCEQAERVLVEFFMKKVKKDTFFETRRTMAPPTEASLDGPVWNEEICKELSDAFEKAYSEIQTHRHTKDSYIEAVRKHPATKALMNFFADNPDKIKFEFKNLDVSQA